MGRTYRRTSLHGDWTVLMATDWATQRCVRWGGQRVDGPVQILRLRNNKD